MSVTPEIETRGSATAAQSFRAGKPAAVSGPIKTGLLTTAGLLRTIEGIVSNRNRAAKLSEAGRNFATRYLNWDNASETYLHLFELILAQQSA